MTGCAKVVGGAHNFPPKPPWSIVVDKGFLCGNSWGFCTKHMDLIILLTTWNCAGHASFLSLTKVAPFNKCLCTSLEGLNEHDYEHHFNFYVGKTVIGDCEHHAS